MPNSISKTFDFHILEKVSAFESLTEPQLKAIAAILDFERYAAGETIILDGDKGDSAFILLSGEVSISKRITSLPDDDDLNPKNKILIRLNAASYPFFGEMAMLDSASERTATVIALQDSEVGVIHTDSFFNLANADRSLGFIVFRNLAKMLSDRLKKANKDIIKLTTALSLALSE
jgi:CRP/FNR family transcriptional regulator, cyclic AMP receptor protein